jgi:hypothetical protein
MTRLAPPITRLASDKLPPVSESAEIYDAVELGRRIVVCFSVGELRQLADSLGVGGSIAWERGIHEASRDVVRQCERYAGLPALVAKLREIRPLVEWPEPAAAAAPVPALPTMLSAMPGAPPASLPAVPTFGAPADPDGAAPPADLPDPFAPPMPLAPPPRALDPQAAPPPRLASPAPAPRPAAWPGMVAEPAPARGIDPRLLVVVAGFMVLAAVIAYLAGRASSAPTAAAPADAATPPPRRGDGPAVLASDAISRSLTNLARVCELPAGVAADVLVFRRVLDRCGPAPPPPRPAATPVATQPDPNAEPPPEPPTRTRRPGRGADPAPPDPGTPSKGCTGACDATHRACKAGCGPEPTESGGYDGYQRCLGRCLSDASRCRLSCR